LVDNGKPFLHERPLPEPDFPAAARSGHARLSTVPEAQMAFTDGGDQRFEGRGWLDWGD
jgi:hypothetical protein